MCAKRLHYLLFLPFFLIYSGLALAEPIADYTWLASLSLAGPSAVAVDDNENVYAAEAAKNQVLQYSSAGQPMGAISGLANPISVAVDGDGRVFVGNAGRGDVEVFSTARNLLFKLGNGNGEVGLPTAIAISEAGLVYVADAKNNTIKVYGLDGIKKFSFGNPGNGNGQLSFPTAIAIDKNTGEIAVADLQVKNVSGKIYGMPATQTISAARVQFFNANGGFLRTFGVFGEGAGKLIQPMGLAIADGRVYVADDYQNVVQVFDTMGQAYGMLYDLNHPLRTPVGLAIGPITGRLFVASLHTDSIEVYASPGLHTISITSTMGGAVTPSGVQSVRQGESLPIKISPADGYFLESVLVDGQSIGAVTEYTLENIVNDHSVAVTFARQTYTITAVAGDHGGISPSGEMSVAYGQDVSFTITPDAGYHVAALIVDGKSMTGGASTSQYLLDNVQADHSIEVQFSRTTYSIVAMTNGVGGSVSPSGTVVVNAGMNQSFSITAQQGYHLVDVKVDNISKGPVAQYTFTSVASAHNLVATFAPDQTYVITASGRGMGAISPSGKVTVAQGASQTFAIMPTQGFSLQDVLVDGVSVGKKTSYTFATVTSNHSIEAVFSGQQSYKMAVTVNGTGGGGVKSTDKGINCPGDCSESYKDSTLVTLTAIPDADSLFTGWQGACTGTATQCKVSMNSAKSVTAGFKPSAPPIVSLKVSVKGKGKVTSKPAGISSPGRNSATFMLNTSVTLTATPQTGSIFKGWSGACRGTAKTCKVVMGGNKSVTALFAASTTKLQDFETGDVSKLSWLTGGADGWTVQNTSGPDESFAIQTPSGLSANEISFLEIPLEVTDTDEISFRFKTSTGQGLDTLSFAIDGVTLSAWTGDHDWTMFSSAIDPGKHILRWEYVREDQQSNGAAWVDNISLPPHASHSYPIVDLKANGMEGPVEVHSNERLVITYAMIAGDLAGDGADWFLTMKTPMGWYGYDWEGGFWNSEHLRVGREAKLEDLNVHSEVLDVSDLAPGQYNFSFVVDTNMNGHLDKPVFLDSIEVKVVK